MSLGKLVKKGKQLLEEITDTYEEEPDIDIDDILPGDDESKIAFYAAIGAGANINDDDDLQHFPELSLINLLFGELKLTDDDFIKIMQVADDLGIEYTCFVDYNGLNNDVEVHSAPSKIVTVNFTEKDSKEYERESIYKLQIGGLEINQYEEPYHERSFSEKDLEQVTRIAEKLGYLEGKI